MRKKIKKILEEQSYYACGHAGYGDMEYVLYLCKDCLEKVLKENEKI